MTTLGATKFDPGGASTELQRVWLGAKDAPANAFSGSYVIEFARARIDHVNTWLNRQLKTMQDGARDSAAVNDVLKVMAQYSEGTEDAKARQDMKDALAKAAADLPPGSPLHKKIEEMRNGDQSPLNVGGDNKVSKAEISSMTTDLQNTIKSIDRRSQEDQLYINQKLGEKNEVLQLAAMLIQSMNDTAKQILGRS